MSVRVAVNDEGDAMGYAEYYPFGMQIASRSNAGGTATKENFTGHELDTETTLLYAGARYYDPALGRWMSPDPLADDYPGWSPYNYALNNPLRLTDPTGMAPSDTTIYDSEGNIVKQVTGGPDYVAYQTRGAFGNERLESLPPSLLSVSPQAGPTAQSQMLLPEGYSNFGPMVLTDRVAVAENALTNPLEMPLALVGLNVNGGQATASMPASDYVAPGYVGTVTEIGILGRGTPPSASSIPARGLVPNLEPLAQPLGGSTLPGAWSVQRHASTGSLTVNQATSSGWSVRSSTQIVRGYIKGDVTSRQIVNALWGVRR